MAMVAAAFVATNRGLAPGISSERRREAYEEQDQFWKEINEQAHFNELRAMLQKYDVDRSGSLEAEELKALLHEHTKGFLLRGKGSAIAAPTDEEISWILRAVGKRNSVNLTELQLAIDLWHSYVMNRGHIEAIFEKYDSNKSNLLEENQLKAYLTEINEGHPPSDHEVRMILKEVGTTDDMSGAPGVSKLKIMLATSMWYTHTEDIHGGCCIIS